MAWCSRHCLVYCCMLLTTAPDVDDDNKLLAFPVISDRCSLIQRFTSFLRSVAALFAPFLLSLVPSPCWDVKWASIFGLAACRQKPSAFLTFPLGSLWNPTIREAQRQQKIRLCSVAKKQREKKGKKTVEGPGRIIADLLSPGTAFVF